MTFSGSINIKQTGHAMLHIDKYDERHLIRFPNVKLKAFSPVIYIPSLVVNTTSFLPLSLSQRLFFPVKGFFQVRIIAFPPRSIVWKTNRKVPYTLCKVGEAMSSPFSIRKMARFSRHGGRTKILSRLLKCLKSTTKTRGKQEERGRRYWQN